MKWLLPITLIVCLSLPGPAMGQHFIGKHKSEVRTMMRENMKDLHEDSGARNTLFNMVKYVDNLGNQTLLYFFSEGDTCLYSKWMCDYFMLNKVVADLNSRYEQSAEDSWHYTHEDRKYLVTLTTGDWYFTITTKPENKE